MSPAELDCILSIFEQTAKILIKHYPELSSEQKETVIGGIQDLIKEEVYP